MLIKKKKKSITIQYCATASLSILKCFFLLLKNQNIHVVNQIRRKLIVFNYLINH